MSDIERITVGVVASTPGANSNTYNMFSSIVTFGTGTAGDPANAGIGAKGISRLEFTLNNDQAGTLRFYRSNDKGLNWYQVGGDISVAASSSTDVNGPYDFLVDPHRDVKLDWINGGSAQTTWVPTVVLIKGQRAAAT